MQWRAVLAFLAMGLFLAAAVTGKAAADEEESYAKVELKGRLYESKVSPVTNYSGPALAAGDGVYQLDLTNACSEKDVKGDAWRKYAEKTVVVTGTLRLDTGHGLNRKYYRDLPFPQVQVEGIRILDK